MNTDQFNSLLRSVLKIAGALLMAHGLTNEASIVNSADFIGLIMSLAGFVLSHFQHRGDSNSGSGNSTVVAFALSAMLALALTGCKDTPQQVAYRVAGTTTVSVDTAMQLWGAYVASNHPGTNAEAQVKSAFEKYQSGMAVALDAGAIYAATSVTNASAASKASLALQQATSTANQELLDLENLITAFGVKLQ